MIYSANQLTGFYMMGTLAITGLNPGDKSKLLFTDAALLTCSIKTEALFRDMYIEKKKFDFSSNLSWHRNIENKKRSVK